MVNTQLLCFNTIPLTDSKCNVWHISPDNNAKSIVVLQVRSSECGWRLDNCRAALTSQMSLYFDKEGFNSNTPLRKRHTNATMEETTLLAVLIALYPMPESYSSAIDSILYRGKYEINASWTAVAPPFPDYGSCRKTIAIELSPDKWHILNIASCEVGGVPVGSWLETDCLCALEVVLIAGLTSALTWATTVDLAISEKQEPCFFLFMNLLENSCYQTEGWKSIS